jgi:hypothetical protein
MWTARDERSALLLLIIWGGIRSCVTDPDITPRTPGISDVYDVLELFKFVDIGRLYLVRGGFCRSRIGM